MTAQTPTNSNSPGPTVSTAPVASTRRWPLPPKPVLLVILLVIVAAAVAGMLWHRHNKPKPIPNTSAVAGVHQSFSKLSAFKLKGTVAGSGISFDKPVQFGSPASETGHAGFEETTSNQAGKNVPLGEIYVLSTPASQAFSATYLQNNDKLMATTDPARLQLALKSSLDFVTQNMPAGYSATLGTPQAFTSDSIKAHAWKMSITAKPIVTKGNTTLPNQDGAVIYVLGAKTYYYFMAATADYNWTNSQASWDKVFSSLKVDQ